ncbi:MAG: rhomboid family intramembrane serine protease [Bdellovibrionales bacterium]|nr:rhomboid family intramembrane serine protease [Bdellovibrionales bacterium]
MIFIPLGLSIPLHRIPWMTLLIAFVTVAFSLRNFGPFENLEKQFYRSEAQRKMLSAKLKILASVCPESGVLAADTCRLVQIVSVRPVENLSQPFNDIKHGLLKGPPSNQDLAFISEFVYSPTIPNRFQSKAKASPDYASWKSAMDQLGVERNHLIGKYGFLSKAHWNFLSLLKAQLTHGGYLHLFGNLLFFVLVSIFVELRLGSLRALGLYTLAGFGGLSAELWHMDSFSTPLIGASANIAGLSGAFAALFWQKRVKVLASFFFVFNRVISIPVYFSFRSWFLAEISSGL